MKRIIGITLPVISMLLSLSQPLAAQELRWAVRGGGADTDFGRAITVDRYGNSYITGLFYNEITFDGVTLTSGSNRDIYLAKFNPDGSLAWAKQTLGVILFGSFGVSADGSGNIYVTGEIRGETAFDDIVITGEPNGDIFIAKYNPDGSPAWAKKIGGSEHDIGRGIFADNSGNFYVTGRFKTSVSFDSFTLNAVRDADIFIARYNADGSVAWARQAGGSLWDEGWDISVDNSGNIFVIGTFQGEAAFDGITLNSAGGSDIFIAKYNPDGSINWVKQTGGTYEYMDGPSISVDDNGNCYVTGSFYGDAAFDDVTLTSYGNTDIFVAKYSPGGSLAWVKQAGGTYNDRGRGIATDDYGNSYVTGMIGEEATFDDITLTNKGTFIAKYDPEGSLLWVKQAGGEGRDISVDDYGNSYIAGDFTGEATFDHTTLTSVSGSDVYAAKYGKGKMCWPPHRGVPYDPDPPTIDGSVGEDTGWRGATRITYGDGTDVPHVAIQTLHHRTDDYLYISFEVRNDVSFDNDDAVVLCFRPKAGSITPANDVGIIIYPLCDNNGAAGPGCTMTEPSIKLDREPRVLEVWKNSAGWTPMTTPPANFEVRVSSYPDGTSYDWDIEIKMPASVATGGDQWVDFADDFLFYANVIRVTNPGGLASQFIWPGTAPAVTGPVSNHTFNPKDWGYATKSSTATCHGVSISSSDVGTTNEQASHIVVHPEPNTFCNTFYANVRNNTELNGTACQANDVRVRFRIANWGLPGPADWVDIDAANPGCPDATLSSNPTCPQDIPAAAGGMPGISTFNLNWTVPDALVPEYLAHEHQCILVELDCLSDAKIVTKSVSRNMDFVTASEFIRPAMISARGYGKPPEGFADQEFYLQVFTREYTYGGGRASDTRKLIALPEKMLVDEKNPVSLLNYYVHGYRNTGQTIIINDKEYYITDPTGSFGYVLSHSGPVKEWKHSMTGCETLWPDNYKMSVPYEEKATVITRIRPVEYLKRWSLGLHGGLAIPGGSLANDYKQGINVLLDADYHFSTQLSFIALFGYNDFRSENAGVDDNYRLNLSANIRYYGSAGVRWSAYLGCGPGLYFPEKGKSGWGVNSGFGLDYNYSSSVMFESGADYHLLFDQDIRFMVIHLGIVFRF